MILRDLPGTGPRSLGEIVALVDTLQRGHLDQHPEPFARPDAVMTAVARLEVLRLRGASRRENRSHHTLPVPMLTSLQPMGTPFAFLVAGSGSELAVGVGTRPDRVAGYARAVQALVGGAAPVPLDLTNRHLGAPHLGCLSGAPGAVGDEPSTAPSVADVLADTLRGARFLYLAFATPEPTSSLDIQIAALRHLAETIDREHLQLGQQSNVNRAAARVRDLLDQAVRRLEAGRAAGMWRVSAVVGAETGPTVRSALSVLTGTLGGGATRSPTPFRAYACGQDPSRGYPVHSNLLTSAELASLCALPGRDRLGFAIHDEVGFDVDVEPPSRGAGLALGEILDGQVPTGHPWVIPTNDLCRHALVAGHTGSGKSTTTRGLLRELARSGTPFLVLEPAKSEYRRLAGEIAQLLVLRVGAPPRPGETPFLLNPLSFPEGFPLHTHIDLFKQTFVASFGLVPPMPYLLETAIYRAYSARGWNLGSGRHPRGHERLSFPTLSDVLAQIDHVVDDAGYDGELSRNLRAALTTRIGNLCQGPKGMSLDTRVALPDDLIFESPLVLELRHLGSDEEKALVMGFILTRLYERREVQGAGGEAPTLRHLLIIEEAHHLLRRVSERSTELGNMAHQAVNTFSNVLAEIRAYGQGVLVLEQIPTLLASEVIKQTSLKVVHRLPPRDDRDELGDTMTLNESQKRALALLSVGQAVVHGEGMDGAIRIQVPAPARTHAASEDPEVRIRGLLGSEARQKIDEHVKRAELGEVLRLPDIRDAADRAILAWVLALPEHGHGANIEDEVGRAIVRMGLGGGGSSVTEAARLAIDDALTRRALYYGWDDQTLVGLRSRSRTSISEAGRELARVCSTSERPYGWCGRCPMPCIAAYEGARIGADPALREDVRDVLQVAPVEAWPSSLGSALRGAGRRTIGIEILPRTVAHCALGHALARFDLGSTRRDAALAAVLESLNPPEDEAPRGRPAGPGDRATATEPRWEGGRACSDRSHEC